MSTEKNISHSSDSLNGHWPDPTPEMLNGDPRFEAIWQTIKSWDINVPSTYRGYMGATGNHARAILDALTPLWPSADRRRKIIGMTPGWVPTYNDPDNSSGAPEAEPIYEGDIPTPSPVAGLPTPETDAAKCRMNICMTSVELDAVSADFARSLERRLAAAESSLAIIGDLAVRDWDDATVGKVDVVLKEPTKYKDVLRRMFSAETDLAAARAEVEAAKEQRRVVHEDTLRTVADLRAQLATAKEERDAALRGVETLRQNSEAMKRALKIHPKSVTSHIAKLESELAKANAAAEEAKIVNESLSQSLTNSHRRERQVEEAHKLANERAASLRDQLAAQQSVPPEARAVECLKCGRGVSLCACLNPEFPPGEGEEWAKAAVAEIFATGRVQNLYPGAPLSTADTLKAIILKHAPARPTAAREDTARLDWLEKNSCAFPTDDHQTVKFATPCQNTDDYEKPTVRAAIDAAMQQGGKTP